MALASSRLFGSVRPRAKLFTVRRTKRGNRPTPLRCSLAGHTRRKRPALGNPKSTWSQILYSTSPGMAPCSDACVSVAVITCDGVAPNALDPLHVLCAPNMGGGGAACWAPRRSDGLPLPPAGSCAWAVATAVPDPRSHRKTIGSWDQHLLPGVEF